MEPSIKASFIPDKMPASQPRGAPATPGGGAGDIFILIAIVALAAALALAAGVFLYDRFLEANVQKKSAQLERARQAFEPVLIQELVRLDARLQAADDILARHLAPSELFNILEELTLQSIEFESLDYTVEDDDSIQLKLKGKARSVNGVALQSSVFGQHNAVENPIFSDLDLVSDGVTFRVSATINPSALRYTTVFSQYSSGVDAMDDLGGLEDFSGDIDTFGNDAPVPGDTPDPTAPTPSEGDFGSFGGGSQEPEPAITQ